MSNIEIPLSAPDITEEEIEAVVSVLRSPRLSLGPKLEEFEHAMAEYVGSEHAVGVSSGTAGLHLALLALGVGPGDEVVVPSFTFVAVANAVRYVGAVPVFADIDAESLNLDPAQVEAAITPRTRALIAVHTFGRPADMAALGQIVRRHHLRLIEDACEALGAEMDGRQVGTFGDAAVFAFYPNKQITTGEGGMVVTQEVDVARRVQALRNHGRTGEAWLEHAEVGYNYRLSEMQCALGIVQLRRIESILARREAVARRYCALLDGNAVLRLPALDAPGVRLSWFVFVVQLAERDGVADAMAKNGIATGQYFLPIHLQPAYSPRRPRRAQSGDSPEFVIGPGGLPVTERVGARTLALPFFNRMTEEQIGRVAEALQEALS
ncbi:MAG TPA: DegT/DnrJ/EryC1/StrS family aminotransferase [Acidobacteriaceae bacterium]|nr:DegT/DnrJ/EryC1/StrS family aminotransferase [Acidobacteriaceae bacterium]